MFRIEKPASLLTVDNIKALSLGLLFFVYTILALSTAQVHYLETLQGITIQSVFDETVFGSTSADGLAAIAFTFLFFSMSFRSFMTRVFLIIIFADCSILFFLPETGPVVAVVALATLPVMVSLLVFARLITKMALVVRSAIVGTPMRSSVEEKIKPVFNAANPEGSESPPLQLKLHVDSRKVAIAFLVVVIVIEAGAILKWASLPIFSASGTPVVFYDVNDPTWKFANIESAVYHSFAILSPVLLVLLAFSFLYKHLNIPGRVASVFRLPSTNGGPTGSLGETEKADLQRNKHKYLDSVPPGLLLVIGMVISVLIAYYPHLPGVNPVGAGISTDEHFYVNTIAELRAIISEDPGGIEAAAYSLNGGDRPWSLLLILALANLTSLPDATIVRSLPLLLAPMFVAASYVLARNAYWILDKGHRDDKIKAKRTNDWFAGLVAILAALSPQVVVGIYGGFLASWLAIIPAIFAMIFLTRLWNHLIYLTNQSFKDYKHLLVDSKSLKAMVDAYGLFLTLVLCMMFHVYTWEFVIAAIALFLVLSIALSNRTGHTPRMSAIKMGSIVALVIGLSIILDYARSTVYAIPVGIQRDSVFASFANISNINSRWESLAFITNEYAGGFLGNPVILVLSLASVLFRVGYSLRSTEGLTFCMLIVFSIAVLFGSSTLQARMVYVIPLFVLAALILLTRVFQSRGSQPKDQILRNICIIAVILALSASALRALAN